MIRTCHLLQRHQPQSAIPKSTRTDWAETSRGGGAISSSARSRGSEGRPRWGFTTARRDGALQRVRDSGWSR